jgi:undecaprenyl-diphosphatase
MSFLQVILLAIIQGLAELLPVSSSAHVVVAEKLLGLDPSSPQMTLVLVMLHTGTMFAVIVYFWHQWRRTYFENRESVRQLVIQLVVTTAITGILGEIIKKIIEKTFLRGQGKAEIEQLFSHLELIAPALAAAGILILVAGLREKRIAYAEGRSGTGLSLPQAARMGAVQGLCLPFRGFSRSGATISTGMLDRVPKSRAEAFSFALAVVLTPPVVLRELLRLREAEHLDTGSALASAMVPSLVGLVCAFFAGLLALRWLSGWLEGGRWYLFGIYCLVAAAVVGYLHTLGY